MRTIGASMVGIGVEFELLNPDGSQAMPKQIATYTALAMAYRGVPVLMTAGHVIRDELEPLLVQKQYEDYGVRVCGVQFNDSLGRTEDVKTRRPKRFPDYPTRPRWAVDDKAKVLDSRGLDFGFIMLPRGTWEGMLDNGVKLLGEEMWEESTAAFDTYKLVGFPINRHLAAEGEAALQIMTVEKIEGESGTTPDGKPAWFVGKPPDEVKTVKGISGGPIFGLRQLPEGGLLFQVVAMQSWQSGGAQRIYGSPLASFGPLINAKIEELQRKASEQEG
jgi:hypothetical protein